MSLCTLPGVLSLSRIALALPTAWALVHGVAAVTLILYAVVGLSDMLDGRIARRRQQASAFGTLLDHGADAIFVTVLCATAAWLGLLPAVLPVLIAIAFLQYVLDSRVLAGATVRGSRLGRLNGIAYFVIVGAAIGVHHFAGDGVGRTFLYGAGWLLVGTTLVSIAERAAHAWRAARRV